jgi:multidrug efflux pump subunit AcrA (membrane-fusion protein)
MYRRWIVLCLLSVMVLAGCGGEPTVQSTPVATAPPPAESVHPSRGGDVVASGFIVPARKALLSFSTAGRVVSVPVQVGDLVQAGDPLIALESELFASDLHQAEAALASALAQLEAAEEGPSPGDVAAAEGAVAAAEGAVAAAQAALVQAELNAETAASQAESSVEIARAALVQAQGTLSATNASLRAAEAYLLVSSEQRDQVAAGAGEPEITAARAEVAWAEMYWKQTREAHDSSMQCFTLPSGDQICPALGTYEEQARQALAAAELNLAAARAYLDRLLAGPEANALGAANANVSMAAAQRDAARAQVIIAEAAVASAEAALAQAQAQDPIALARAAVAAAQAQVQLAEGQLSQAVAQRDRLVGGATAQEIAQLEAQVAQAQAALTRTEWALAGATLSAPFDGTVASLAVNRGESILPGQVVLTLADLTRLQVETSDLSERDVDRVAVGQPAIVYVEALGVEVEGQVAIIQPLSSTIGGDVVYRVIVQLAELPEGIRWGMSVEVEISAR